MMIVLEKLLVWEMFRLLEIFVFVLVVMGVIKLVNGLLDSSKTAVSCESAVNTLCETRIEEFHDKNVSTTG